VTALCLGCLTEDHQWVTSMEADKLRDCPVLDTIHAIGGKWKPRILWHLRNGAATFGELRRVIEISEKVLHENLRALQRDGLISRQPYKRGSVEFVEYDYTDYGRTLIPVLNAVGNWGVLHKTRSD
jgi:DNA-binding HxlR family transcriptional regulator